MIRRWQVDRGCVAGMGPPRRRRGAIALVAALMLVALVGILALTLEGGLLLVERRHAQAVADSAALAAACDLSYNYGFNAGTDPQGTAKASALSTAAANGYNNDGTTSIVAANLTTQAGPGNNPTFRAEAVVTGFQPRGFSAIFGSQAPVPVSARAVAGGGSWQPAPPALLLLEPDLPASLVVAANNGLTITNGPVESNSTSALATALVLNGRISAPSYLVRGGSLATANGQVSGPVTTMTDPFPDPLAYLSPPDPATLPVRNTSLLTIGLLGQPITLQPGVYYGGIRILTTANVTMQPGIYYMAGGGFTVVDPAVLPLGTRGTVTGSGVTIVNAPVLPTDAITIAGTGGVQLSPPTSGLYQGITIMQPPALLPLPLGINPMMTIAGNSLFGTTFSISGTVYAPRSTITLAANGTMQLGSQVIARSAVIGGNGLPIGTVRINWTTAVGRSPLPVRLIE